MLVVKIEVDKTKENYKAVMDALADFDINSASWEDQEVKVNAKASRTGDDLSSAISSAVSALAKARGR